MKEVTCPYCATVTHYNEFGRAYCDYCDTDLEDPAHDRETPEFKVTVDVDPSVTEEQLEGMVKDLKAIIEKQRVQTQWHVYSQDPSRDKWPVAILEDKDEAIQYVKERIRKDILAKNIREYELREGWKPRDEALKELEPVMETFDASEFFHEDGSPMEIDVWCEGEWRYTIAPVSVFKKKGA